jgi:hypothetical protein
MCGSAAIRGELNYLDGNAGCRPHMPGAEKDDHQFHKPYDVLETLREERIQGYPFERCPWVDDLDHRWKQDIRWIHAEIRDE